VPWLVCATIGDAPLAVIACAAIVLGVVIMARGRRGETFAPSGAAPQTPPAAAAAATPVVAAAAPPAVAEAPATTFRHGAIKLADEPEPGPAPAAPPLPPAAPAQPEPAAEPEPPPAAPAPPPPPQAPPTGFRQGRIRVGGLERGRRRDPE
jgi:outer membrane biosynthesis protein TonB